MKKLKIMPCPVNVGKHSYHDNRWIVTEDAEVEFYPHVPNDWHLRTGSLIAQMRDVPAEYAVCLAAAPELLSQLKMALGALESVKKKNPFIDDTVSGEVTHRISKIKEVIAKAEKQPEPARTVNENDFDFGKVFAAWEISAKRGMKGDYLWTNGLAIFALGSMVVCHTADDKLVVDMNNPAGNILAIMLAQHEFPFEKQHSPACALKESELY